MFSFAQTRQRNVITIALRMMKLYLASYNWYYDIIKRTIFCIIWKLIRLLVSLDMLISLLEEICL